MVRGRVRQQVKKVTVLAESDRRRLSHTRHLISLSLDGKRREPLGHRSEGDHQRQTNVGEFDVFQQCVHYSS